MDLFYTYFEQFYFFQIFGKKSQITNFPYVKTHCIDIWTVTKKHEYLMNQMAIIPSFIHQIR